MKKQWKHLMPDGNYCFFDEDDIHTEKIKVIENDCGFSCKCGNIFKLKDIRYVPQDGEQNPYEEILDDLHQAEILK